MQQGSHSKLVYNKPVHSDNLAASYQQALTSYQQAGNKNCTHNDNKLLEQRSYKSAAALFQVLRFRTACVCFQTGDSRAAYKGDHGTIGH